MLDYSYVIIKLYNDVLAKEIRKFYVSEASIRDAIQNMKHAYMPNPSWELDHLVSVVNYNTPAHRCAYMHKYAMCYTGMVYETLKKAFNECDNLFNDINRRRYLNLCSLGGGPGTDIVAMLAVFLEFFGFIECSATIIDSAREWKSVFTSIIEELQNPCYGKLRQMVSFQYFSYNYLGANLLSEVKSNPLVRQEVMRADVITMVKFISAAACDQTRRMVKDIFESMKPGALLLFIDNAAGGFDRMLQQVAAECGMRSAYGPLFHQDYENENFAIMRYGYTSQSKTKVSIQIWKKPENYSKELQYEYMTRRPILPRTRPASKNNSFIIAQESDLSRGKAAEDEPACCSLI